MTIFYSTQSQRVNILAPQVTRWRHRFRGQRESYKFNMHWDQMAFDLYNLYDRTNDLESDLKAKMSLLEYGGNISGLYFRYEDAATPSDEPVGLLGKKDLEQMITDIEKRIRVLEK